MIFFDTFETKYSFLCSYHLAILASTLLKLPHHHFCVFCLLAFRVKLEEDVNKVFPSYASDTVMKRQLQDILDAIKSKLAQFESLRASEVLVASTPSSTQSTSSTKETSLEVLMAITTWGYIVDRLSDFYRPGYTTPQVS